MQLVKRQIMIDIDLSEYKYDLPAEKIAQYPVNERDMSKLLVCKGEIIKRDIFRNVADHIPAGSLLVFNNTKVIRARILFRKNTGAGIEILCLEPLLPSDYESAFGSKDPVEWKCIIGNLKKWKKGILNTPFIYNDQTYILNAEKIKPEDDAWRVRFRWDCDSISFSEVIEAIGHVPLPPYINREDEAEDNNRYQTVYSRIKGSVAAPTAGLHFTDRVLETLHLKGIKSAELTLHVGTGTFQPVKSKYISGHEMHCEHFFVPGMTIKVLMENQGRIVAVGTTSVRTIESLYWLGVKILRTQDVNEIKLSLGQWEAYELDGSVSVEEALLALINFLKKKNLEYLSASTSMIIVPGYRFRLTDGLITNFHQPGSTLLLLVSAFIGKTWKKVYEYALENEFRFLSYGDSSLLLK
jgi:S-adenosylmethionine:tRNA ribosyltransferase-isomerase